LSRVPLDTGGMPYTCKYLYLLKTPATAQLAHVGYIFGWNLLLSQSPERAFLVLFSKTEMLSLNRVGKEDGKLIVINVFTGNCKTALKTKSLNQ
jgi:hypothetical protein